MHNNKSSSWAALCLLLLVSFVLVACQAPLISQGSSASLTIDLNSLPLPQTATASRALSPDASTIELVITRPDRDHQIVFSSTVAVQTDANGKSSARLSATGLPLSVPLQLRAEVRDSGGNLLFEAQGDTTLSSSNGPALSMGLIPAPGNPFLINFITGASLTLTANEYRLIKITLDATQASQRQRLLWNDITSDLAVRCYHQSGLESTGELVNAGKGGLGFNTGTAGTYYALVHNQTSSTAILNNIRLEAHDLDPTITFTIDNPVSGLINFPQSSPQLIKGDTLTISNDLYTAISGWQWFVDGAIVNGQNSSTFIWNTTNARVGDHIIAVQVVYQGILQSGSIKVKVTAAPIGGYSLVYRVGGDVSGTVPAALANITNAIISGDGDLKRAGALFHAWRVSAGTDQGRILLPGDSINLSANTELEPVWMPYVAGGQYQRDTAPGNISKVEAFYASPYEVTQSEYLSIMGGNPSAYAGTANAMLLPVEKVSWYNAIDFCNRLSAKRGLAPVYSIDGNTNPGAWTSGTIVMNRSADGYRLPTEAEWMWAAMGGTRSGSPDANGTYISGYAKAFAGSNGGNDASMYAHFPGSGGPEPVGSRLPNELGLYDMSGNIYEKVWDSDYGHPAPTALPAGFLDNPTGFGGNSAIPYHISRGGSWKWGNIAVNFRDGTTLKTATDWDDNGFRVVRGAPGVRHIPANGLVGQWLFDNDGRDTSGNGNNATLYGSPQGTFTTNRNGETARALSNPTSAYTVLLNGSHAKGAADSFSFGLWFNATSLPGPGNFPHLVSHWADTDKFSYGLIFKENTIYAIASKAGDSSQTNTIDSPTLLPATWYHVFVVIGNNQISLYLNGQLIEQATLKASNTVQKDSAYPFHIGGGINSPSFNGVVDNVRFYNRALTATEVQTLYMER